MPYESLSRREKINRKDIARGPKASSQTEREMVGLPNKKGGKEGALVGSVRET